MTEVCVPGSARFAEEVSPHLPGSMGGNGQNSQPHDAPPRQRSDGTLGLALKSLETTLGPEWSAPVSPRLPPFPFDAG